MGTRDAEISGELGVDFGCNVQILTLSFNFIRFTPSESTTPPGDHFEDAAQVLMTVTTSNPKSYWK